MQAVSSAVDASQVPSNLACWYHQPGDCTRSHRLRVWMPNSGYFTCASDLTDYKISFPCPILGSVNWLKQFTWLRKTHAIVIKIGAKNSGEEACGARHRARAWGLHACLEASLCPPSTSLAHAVSLGIYCEPNANRCARKPARPCCLAFLPPWYESGPPLKWESCPLQSDIVGQEKVRKIEGKINSSFYSKVWRGSYEPAALERTLKIYFKSW